MKMHNHILFIFLLSLATLSVSQDYTQDSLAVRAILDSNDLSYVGIPAVTAVKDNRIYMLHQPGGIMYH